MGWNGSKQYGIGSLPPLPPLPALPQGKVGTLLASDLGERRVFFGRRRVVCRQTVALVVGVKAGWSHLPTVEDEA